MLKYKKFPRTEGHKIRLKRYHCLQPNEQRRQTAGHITMYIGNKGNKGKKNLKERKKI